MRIFVISVLNTIWFSTAFGQYFHFSQINYTDQRINPAVVASSDYAFLNFAHRNQKTGGDFNLNSSFASASYPLLSKKNGVRWAGLGVTLMDDRSGGIFKIQEASLSYAANIYLSKWQTISLGAKGLYQQRKIDLDGLYTGMQYVPDRGFDEGALSGENFHQLNNDFFTLSLGVLWQRMDRKNDRIGYISLSFFDINKPKDSFLGTESELRGAFVSAMGLRIYQKGSLSVFPELLFSSTYANNLVNLGAIWQYKINSTQQETSRVDIITKYVLGRYGIVGLQLHRENFSVGFSYDFPVIVNNTANTGAFEIGFQFRRLVDARLKARASRKKQNDKKIAPTSAEAKKQVQPVSKTKVITKAIANNQEIKSDSVRYTSRSTLKESLKMKQDSIDARVEAGGIRHEPVELEKATLHFNFDFNSTDINQTSSKYLDEVADVLVENKRLNLTLTGHTDNIGSDRFNLRLSKERAQAIKEYLVDRGVTADRIMVDGKGMREPLNNNTTEEERALNRRVELSIIYK